MINQNIKRMMESFKKNKLLYTIIAYTFFASIAHINELFQIILIGFVVTAPIFMDDTDCVCMFVYSSCFMNCYTTLSYLWVLAISAFILEIKKIYISIKIDKNFKDISLVIFVWLGLSIILLIYSFIYNKFHIYRLSAYVDILQCFLVFYLLKDSINLKKVVVTLAYAVILSTIIGILFHYACVYSSFTQGLVGNRFGGFFRNINSLGMYCTITTTCLVALLINKHLDRKYIFLSIGVTIVGLITYSKSFILLNLLIYLSWTVYSFVKSKDKAMFVANSMFVLSFIIILVAIANNYLLDIINRFLHSTDKGLLDSFTTGRVNIWYEYIDQWLANPLTTLFGNGCAAPKVLTEVYSRYYYEHGLYVAFLYRFGIIGSIIVLATMIWTVIKDRLPNKSFGNYLPLIVMMIYAIVENITGMLFTFIPLCLALMVLMYNPNKTIKENN